MFTLSNITKSADQTYYSVSSLACPSCKGVLVLDITPAQLFAYNQGMMIQDVLFDQDADVRERFMSGWCESCWM